MAPANAEAISMNGAREPGVDAAYLERLNAPFDWQDAQRRVLLSAAPAD
jgi:hypothetical protein